MNNSNDVDAAMQLSQLPSAPTSLSTTNARPELSNKEKK